MEKTIPIFQALLEVEPDDKFHRTHAQLGYALKDKRDPSQKELADAEAALSKAIEIRDKHGKDREEFLWYEFNRAICRIKLDSAFQQQKPSLLNIREAILNDLQTASQDPNIAPLLLKDDLDNPNPIGQWLAVNKVCLETLNS